VLHAFGEEVTILLDGELTSGTLTMWTEVTPPGGGPPPHYHLNEDEAFHVLEGRVAFFSGGEWHEVGPGAESFTHSRMLVISRLAWCSRRSRQALRNSLRVAPKNSRSRADRLKCRHSSRSAPRTELISCCSHGPVGRLPVGRRVTPCAPIVNGKLRAEDCPPYWPQAGGYNL
jgi:Cupin domain